MIYLNQHQPRRSDRHPVTGEKLMFRTYPIFGMNKRVYRTCEASHRLAQMVLYRWTFSEEFVSTPGCGDLYEYLVKGQGLPKVVSLKAFGSTVINALNYECRRLKGISKDNDKVRQVYHFGDPYELRYGLEYMICAWLRRFLKTQSASGDEAALSGPHVMQQELEILVNSDQREWWELYVTPMLTMDKFRIDEPDWAKLLRLHSVTSETEMDTESMEFESVSTVKPLKSY